MDLKKLEELQIPQEANVRNKVLNDALSTQNPLLIEFALAIGADPLAAGKRLLTYAVRQGKLELIQQLYPTIADGLAIAMDLAMSEGQLEIAEWLLEKGAVMKIDSMCIGKHASAVKYLLNGNTKAKADIQYEALESAVCLPVGAAETVEILLGCLKRNSHKDLPKWLVRLADYTVDTQRTDCMEIMRYYGLDLAYVNTKYCSREMQKYLEEHGVNVQF